MKCEEFLGMLDSDEGWRDKEAQAHAEACPSCRKAAERWSAASKAFAAMKEDEAPPFIHTRIMARVREEGARKPFWSALGLFRAAWAGPLLVLAIAFVVGGYGLVTIIEPTRKAVPQSELAKPEEMARGDNSPKDNRLPTPQVELPRLAASPAEAKPRPTEERNKYAATEAEPELAKKREDASAFVPTAQRDEEASQAGAPAQRALTPGPLSRNASVTGEGPAKGVLSAAPETARKQEASAPPPPGRYVIVDLVECTLKAEGGKEYVVLKLPPSESPPEGQLWEVTVAKDGAIEVKDTHGQHKESLKEILESRIQELNLLPGRYHLGRMGQ